MRWGSLSNADASASGGLGGGQCSPPLSEPAVSGRGELGKAEKLAKGQTLRVMLAFSVRLQARLARHRSSRHSREHFLNCFIGTVVGVVQQMRVDAQCDLRARVAKAPAHGDDVDIGVDQARCMGMPQGM
jgi:hypothetical protein